MADTTFFSPDSSASQDTQLDKASAPGLIGDEHEELSDAEPKEEEDAEFSASTSSATSSSSASAVETSSDAKKSEDDVTTPGADTKPSDPSQTPTQSGPDEFSELQGDVSELAQHLEEDAIEALKKAGNAVTPAVGKLHGIEEKLEHMDDELKNRFVHVKTQLVNAMGALERLFKRGK